jgi:hypothetical protein
LVSSGVFIFFVLYGYFLVSETWCRNDRSCFVFYFTTQSNYINLFLGSYICSAKSQVSWAVCDIHSVCVIQFVCNNRITVKKRHRKKVKIHLNVSTVNY